MNRNNRFESADSGVTTPLAARGAAFGDLNNDGWEDVVVTSLGGHPQVLMNNGGKAGRKADVKAHWLTISLRGTRSNRDGFGARVLGNGQTRFASSAGSVLSSSDKPLHSVLAPSKKAKL